MKWFLNDKGMMFGNRINIIDFLVCLFILSLSPILYYGWKIFHKSLPNQKPNWEQKYNDEISNKEKVFKKHPRLRNYFITNQSIPN